MTTHNDPATPPPAPQVSFQPAAAQQPPPPVRKKRSWLWLVLRGFLVLALFGSIILNVSLLMLVALQMGGDLRTQPISGGESDQVVAVWDVAGVIESQTAETFNVFYRKVYHDPDVKAVVIRVDSGGGGVAASDEIYSMVKSLAQKKPVVISMGGLAASGGYYISAPAACIIAEPTTLTGSIGVIAMIPNFEGTAEKIGMKMNVIKSSHADYWKDMLSPFRDISPRHRERFKTMLDTMQAQFEFVVNEGREGKLNKRPLKFKVTLDDGQVVERTETEPFNGMAYTADEALELGLIDEIGYESLAMDRAAELAGLDKPKFVQYQEILPVLSGLFGAQTAMDLPKLDVVERMQSPQFMYLWTLP